MANTEHMSDEAMSSIFGPPSSGSLRSGHSTPMPQRSVGGRPAASVLRRSKQPQSSPMQHDQDKLEPEAVSSNEIPMIGDVKERVPTRTAINARPKSKFTMERQGFPSLSRPIGAFIKAGAVVEASSKRSEPFFTPNDTSNDPALSPSAIDRDADALLKKMSGLEIKETVQELEAVLPTEMLLFLKNRKKAKVDPGSEKKATVESEQRQQSPSITNATQKSDTKEKTRIAQVMASIQTLEDLDKAYETEMGIVSDFDTARTIMDWTQACNLLRSTSMRQALWAAKTVCQMLEMDVRNNNNCRIGKCTTELPYPAILPVSLRCLLDTPSPSGGLLHTYVLRSIFALLQLRAPSDHVVDVLLSNKRSTILYQECFLDDAIPTLPFGVSYPKVAITPVYSNSKGDAVAYSTSSSSTSATQDATAFWSDPMWTLLTKMKMIPRLAQLSQTPQLPREATVATCGILAMMSIRSPGAAAAIAQHETLLPSILRRSLMPPDEASLMTDYLNQYIAVPTMVLLCTMARQSRAVAAAIPFDSIGPPILAMDSCYPTLIQWTLILWRILLRYGLGLKHLQFAVARSVLHLAKARSIENPLAVEFLTCFSNVLDSVKVAKHKNTTSTYISLDDWGVLMNAEGWLMSTLKQSAEILETSMEHGTRLKAACLSLLQSHVSIYSPIDNETKIQLSDSFKDESVSLLYKLRGLSVDGTLTAAIEKVFGDDVYEIRDEAASSAFLSSFVALITSLFSLWDSLGCTGQGLLTEISQILELRFTKTRSRSCESDRVRQGWLNQSKFRIIRFLVDRATCDISFRSARSLAFDLLGQLGQGDEAQAAILFSKDHLFIPYAGRANGASRLSSMFMSDLCSSIDARKQLDHSFKLIRGFGITTDGWGTFALNSLLSETEQAGPKQDADNLLPLGSLWLWQVLSGCARDSQSDDENEDNAAIQVSCLELILDLELSSDSFAASRQLGSKLYYLTNLCLATELILRNDDVSMISSKLIDVYVLQLENEDSFGFDMVDACFKHSIVPKLAADTDADARKVTALYESLTGSSTVQVRAFVDFVSDLCTAFIEYGAQYDVFVKCIRILWRPEFPCIIRIETLTRLRDLSPLLTLPDEVESWATLAALAVGYLFDGIPGEEGVKFESAAMLDMVATILKTDSYKRIDPQAQKDFFLLVACAMLGRSLSGSIKHSSSLAPSMRRIVGLPTYLGKIVCQLPLIFLTSSTSVTAKSLVKHTVSLFEKTHVGTEIGTEFTTDYFISELKYTGVAIGLKEPSL